MESKSVRIVDMILDEILKLGVSRATQCNIVRVEDLKEDTLRRKLIIEVKKLLGEEISVISSNVSAVAFDHDTCTLKVRFKGGGLYEYPDTPHELFEEFLNAPSKGKFFNKNVRGRSFKKL